jgi:hypothetical protein
MDVRPDAVTPAEALGTRLAAPEEEKYSMDTLTIQQAFEAMQPFLVSCYERAQSDDVGALLGDLQCMEDGVTADLATWQAWMDCVKKVADRGSTKPIF